MQTCGYWMGGTFFKKAYLLLLLRGRIYAFQSDKVVDSFSGRKM